MVIAGGWAAGNGIAGGPRFRVIGPIARHFDATGMLHAPDPRGWLGSLEWRPSL
jgi:hypothetical protein